ncbi:MAG: DUF1801 domain-containing protein [Archangiaceae bacterium]|nr:DUF1801 domain-containing protein [Archangiaceae bacterium]
MTVTEYIAGQPAPVRKVLKQVRALMRKALPDAEESVSYGIATYKIGGKPVIYFAGFPRHWSVFPCNGPAYDVLRARLEPHRVSKGTLRFALDEKVPAALLTRYARLRARDVRARQKPARGARR